MSTSHISTVIEDVQYEVRVAGRFKMGKKIGSGSFGEIFLALDMHTGKEVAIKFVLIISLWNFRNQSKLEDLS